ncbi:uncharacterized protein LOC135682311 isoform X2 [Rhopilema esculentum]|uniref:uncharacterized protein LOC135682311 isoform X2 n=1 Tax=Rhopilema esculentum TaxID=499914 RepID=UPI0031DADF97
MWLSASNICAQCCFAVMIGNAFVFAQEQCKVTDPCSCRFDDGRKISLRPIDRKGSPRFTVISATTGATFKYNPCTPFSADKPSGQCVNVLACQSGLIGATPIALAYPNSTASKYDSRKDKYTFVYTGGSTGSQNLRYKTILVLNCDKKADSPSLTSFQYTEAFTYEATLTSKYACPSSVLSTGSILCIVFFSLLLAYLVIGTLLNKFAFHKEGSDVIPQRIFWLKFPGLVKIFSLP